MANLLDSTLIGFSQGKHLYTSHFNMPVLSFSCSDIGQPLAQLKKKANVIHTSTPMRGVGRLSQRSIDCEYYIVMQCYGTT